MATHMQSCDKHYKLGFETEGSYLHTRSIETPSNYMYIVAYIESEEKQNSQLASVGLSPIKQNNIFSVMGQQVVASVP